MVQPDFRSDLEKLLSASAERAAFRAAHLPVEGHPCPFGEAQDYANQLAAFTAGLAFSSLRQEMRRWGPVADPDFKRVQHAQLDLEINVALARLRAATKTLMAWWDSRDATRPSPRLPKNVLEQLAQASSLLETAWQSAATLPRHQHQDPRTGSPHS